MPRTTHPTHRSHGRLELLAIGLLLSSFSTGCAFIDNAAELTVGEGQVPEITNDTTLSPARLNAAIQATIGHPAPETIIAENFEAPTNGVFNLEADATWQDVRIVLCDAVKAGLLSYPRVDVDFSPESVGRNHNLRTAQLRLEVPIDDGELISCYRNPIQASATVSFVPFTATQSAEIRAMLDGQYMDLGDAISQLRLNFSALEFRRQESSVVSKANEILSDFESLIADPNLEDDPETPYHDAHFELVPFFLLDTISAETPQRFELDPDSPVTESVRGAIADIQTESEQLLQIHVTVTVPAEELAATPVQGSGISVSFQPEVVLDARQLL